MKIPKGKLRAIKAQMKLKIEEGEIDARESSSLVWTSTDKPEKKRKVRRNLKTQVYDNGGLTKRVRSFNFAEGDLVEVHRVEWNMRGVKKGDIGMVMRTSHNGERVDLQIGPNMITVPGGSLRPLGDDEYEDADDE